MSHLTGTLRNSGQNFVTETVHRAAAPVHTTSVVNRDEEFLRFFNRYEHRGTDNHSYFGQADVYHMNERDAERVRNAKMARIDERASQFHHHHERIEQGKVPLRDYVLDIPQYLPERVATKRIALNTQADQQLAEQIRRAVSSGQYQAFNYTQIFATQQTQNELTVYFEYQNTLADDIANRREQRNPFYEELLWKLLFNLASASSRLSAAGTPLEDIRPSQVSYNDFQASVLPVNLNRNSFLSNFQQGRPVFFSEDHYLLRQSQVGQSQQLRTSQLNESFQIGMTVLCAGLLLQESEVQVCNNRQFSQQQLERLLEDFGRIYSRQDRLLVYFLRQFLLSSSRVSPSELVSILQGSESQIIFLDHHFKHHVRGHLERTGLINSYSDIERQQGITQNNEQLRSIWNNYPAHFSTEIARESFLTQKADIERRNQQVNAECAQIRQNSDDTLARVRANNERVNQELIRLGKAPINIDYNNLAIRGTTTGSQIVGETITRSIPSHHHVTTTVVRDSQPIQSSYINEQGEHIVRTSHIHGSHPIRQSGQVTHIHQY